MKRSRAGHGERRRLGGGPRPGRTGKERVPLRPLEVGRGEERAEDAHNGHGEEAQANDEQGGGGGPRGLRVLRLAAALSPLPRKKALAALVQEAELQLALGGRGGVGGLEGWGMVRRVRRGVCWKCSTLGELRRRVGAHRVDEVGRERRKKERVREKEGQRWGELDETNNRQRATQVCALFRGERCRCTRAAVDAEMQRVKRAHSGKNRREGEKKWRTEREDNKENQRARSLCCIARRPRAVLQDV